MKNEARKWQMANCKWQNAARGYARPTGLVGVFVWQLALIGCD
jgi:hypothetical protein